MLSIEYAANQVARPDAAGRLAAARKFDAPGEPSRSVALGLYQGVSTAFPGTFEAQRADARVRAMTGKLRVPEEPGGGEGAADKH